MAAHARLKNGFTEEEKNHNLMSWLIWYLIMDPTIQGEEAFQSRNG